MTVTITGAVTVNGVRIPVTAELELPDAARSSGRSENSATPNHLRVVPKAS